EEPVEGCTSSTKTKYDATTVPGDSETIIAVEGTRAERSERMSLLEFPLFLSAISVLALTDLGDSSPQESKIEFAAVRNWDPPPRDAETLIVNTSQRAPTTPPPSPSPFPKEERTTRGPAQVQFGCYIKSQSGYRSFRSVFLNVTLAENVNQCLLLCSLVQRYCAGFNYRRSASACHLLGESPLEEDLGEDEDFTAYWVYEASAECRRTALGKEYEGIRAETATRRPCVPWSRVPSHDFRSTDFPDANVEEAKSSCRNPDNRPQGPWCFVDFGGDWEYCSIPYCLSESPVIDSRSIVDSTKERNAREKRGLLLRLDIECRMDTAGIDYRGTMSITISGRHCQRWSARFPHSVPNRIQDRDFPDGSKVEAVNFCRNPDESPRGPWCYTEDPYKVREECPVPMCPEVMKNSDHPMFEPVSAEPDYTSCKKDSRGTTYLGKLNHTASGRPCQNWTADVPHFRNMEIMEDDNFPDGSTEKARNFCRNPDGYDLGPWCYTGDPLTRWEVCAVPWCKGRTRLGLGLVPCWGRLTLGECPGFESWVYRGFKQDDHYRPVAKITCGENTTSDSGYIMPPEETYLNNMHCVWCLRLPNATEFRQHGVALQFYKFHLEDSKDCQYDYLEARESSTISIASRFPRRFVYDGCDSEAAKLGRYCGKNGPKALFSTGPEIMIVFSSDPIGVAEGFGAMYLAYNREDKLPYVEKERGPLIGWGGYNLAYLAEAGDGNDTVTAEDKEADSIAKLRVVEKGEQARKVKGQRGRTGEGGQSEGGPGEAFYDYWPGDASKGKQRPFAA
ncbi:unnamed protein product, partial [Darwinula stevensoni]